MTAAGHFATVAIAIVNKTGYAVPDYVHQHLLVASGNDDAEERVLYSRQWTSPPAPVQSFTLSARDMVLEHGGMDDVVAKAGTFYNAVST
ncbi:hypothetical protein LTR17_027369, partial [Elasticomyces elasticus]